MRFLILGGGAQGSAAAYDLARREEVTEVILADRDVSRPAAFLATEGLRAPVTRRTVDARDEDGVLRLMDGVDSVFCALPYYFNEPMTRLALRSGAHFTDLGGNTEIVGAQKKLHEEAVAAGLSVIPDSGLAPGLVNILAQGGIDALDRTDSVRMWVGGLPRDPRPPLNYHIVYSLEGVLDYYTTEGVVLRDGEPVSVEPLAGIETLDFGVPLGELEAFNTAGGISTLPYRYRGRIREMVYKTLRYPGHAGIMRAIRDLGLLDVEPVRLDGFELSPRRFFIDVVSPRLRDPDARDLVVLRVDARGWKGEEETLVRFELLDFFDEETGMTAMMRVTGFSLAITGLMQARGEVEAGVLTPDEAVSVPDFIAALGDRGIRVERDERSG